MAFLINLKFDDGGAAAKVKDVETGLGKATDSAGRAREAMGRFVKGAGEAGAAGAKAGEDTSKGMDKAVASTDKATAAHGKAKKAAEDHGDALSNLIHLAEAYFAVHQIESLVDGYIEIRNKTNSVADSASNLNALMDEQFRIAQETRSSWEDLAGSYQRIANASRGLGLSQRDVLNITEEVSMGMRLSGASSREAAMSMMELTHAFTVGTLTGREYRVLAKDAPAFLHEIQVASGKTGAEFAEMGKTGKITAQLLVDWLGKAAPDIRDKFGQMIPTVSEGFTIIRNAAEKFFGQAGVGSGVVDALGRAMKFVADNFETFGKAALGVGEALIGLYALEKIVGLVKALTLAIAANPLGALLIAVTAGVSLLRQFGDELQTSTKIWTNVGDKFVTIGDNIRALWEQLKTLGAEILKFVSSAWNALTNAVGDGLPTDKVEDSLSSILKMVSAFVGAIKGLWEVLSEDTHKTFQIMEYWITTAMIAAANASVHAIEAIAAAPRHALFDTLNQTNDKRAAAAAEARKEIYEDQNKDADKNWSVNSPRLSTNQLLYNKVKEDLGYNPLAYSTTGEHVVTRDEVWAEFKRRQDIQYQASLVNAYAQRGLDAQGNDLRDASAKPSSFNIPNPYAGTETERVAKDALKDIFYSAKKSADEFDKISHSIAAARVMEDKPKGEVGTTKGAAEAAAQSEKKKKAAETFANRLRTVTEEVNPQIAAIEKLSHAHSILEEAVRRGNISQDEAQRLTDLYAKKLDEQIHPFDAWIRKQNEATASLRATSEEQERAAKLQSFAADLRSKQGGVEATSAELDLASRQIEADQKKVEIMRAEQSVTASLLGPQHAYQVQLEAIGDLLHNNYINADQYNQQVDKARAAYLSAADGTRTFGELVEVAWTSAQESARKAGVEVEKYQDVVMKTRIQQIAAGEESKTFDGALESAWLKARLEAESYGAVLANQLVGDIDKLNEAIVSMANGGKVAWGEMVDSIIQDLEKLIIKQLEVLAVTALINAIAPGAGSAATSSGATGGAIGALNDSLRGLGFATGGDLLVGGHGGTDSQIVAFRATPGEHVAIRTPQQYGQASAGQQTSQAPVHVHVKNINQMDPREVHAAMDTPAGEHIVVNIMRRNQATIRSYSGTRK